MSFMSLNNRLFKFGISLVLVLFVAASGVTAQSKRSAKAKPADKKAAKKSDDKKSAKNSKDTKSKNKKDDVASKSKNSKKDSKKDKESTRAKNDRRDSKKDRESARDNRRDKSSKDKDRKDDRRDTASKKDKKASREERRQAEIARRRAEEERRQAILAEQRRRAEAARIARERFLAFQRGLRNETEENIAKDNTEGEDLRVRAAAVNALGDKAGTVVVMEAQTGKVLTIVNQDWAIRTAYRPCSTIKLVTGVAGVTEKVINEEGTVGESGGMSLDTALARSNNYYFQRVGQNLGNGKMISYAKKLGLGEPTGINAEGETAGRLPYGNNSAKIYSHGDDFELSPLQLAVLASEIANGGKRVVPQIPKGNFERAGFRPHVKSQIDLPQQDLEGVIPGMIGAAEWGTAHRGVDASLGIAGKTGSCITKGTWIGLFTSVAPIENPKYAVAVITRGASERGKYAAAVAGRVYQALAPQIRPARNVALAEARFKNKSRVPANVANKVVDEDEDDADDAMAAGGNTDAADAAAETNAASPAPQVVVPQYRQPVIAQPVQKPLVNKIVQSKPKFPPVVITYKKDEDELNDNPEQRSTNQKTIPAGQRPRVVKNK